MQKILKVKISLLLAIVLVLAAVGGTWGITYYVTKPDAQPAVTDETKNPKAKTIDELYAEAVDDAMTVEVAYTVTADEMLSMLADGSWLPDTAEATKAAA